MFNRIAIVGVGLIGGSIGLAVRRRRLAKKVVGIGRRKSSIDKAVSKSAIDTGTLNLKKGVEGADLIVIATPIEKVKAKIRESSRYAKKGAIIIDVNSTKQDIIRSADKDIPKGISFVATHPIAGSEQAGVGSSDSELFNKSTCIITPASSTNKNALEEVKAFWKSLGAEVRIMSPGLHDSIVADISHLPHVLAYALCSCVPAGEFEMAGTGFKDVTRVAKSSPNMWQEVFIQNRKELLKSIRAFQKTLNILKNDITKKRTVSIKRRLSVAKRKRNSLG